MSHSRSAHKGPSDVISIINIIDIIIIINIIPTAPRIPPHRPPRTDKGSGVMSFVSYLLSSFSGLVAKVLSALSYSLAG